MIITEEEAKTKRCQETFGPPIQSVGSGFFTASPPISNCIGSACMAWRYYEAVPKIEIFVQGETDADYVARRDRVMAVLTGYCGKAGRP